MKRRTRIIALGLTGLGLIVAGVLIVAAAGGGGGGSNAAYERMVHGSLPAVVGDADILAWRDTSLGGQGQDLSGKDFSGVSQAMMYTTTFDTTTRWPDAAKLPTGFGPAQALAVGRDPGLGIRGLHARGITGAGVAVAVIDKPIRQDHIEFSGRLTYVEVDQGNRANSKYHFHGMACASILAGATTGVAPASDLYYLAVPDNTITCWANYTAAIERILSINAGLPRERQIRVVSLSDGPMPKDAGTTKVAEFLDAVKRAEAQGVAVVNCDEVNFAIRLGCAGALPGRDRDDPASYDPWVRAPEVGGGALALPGDYRTTASNDGADIYAFWGDGGRSWACPYLAGVLALGLQVNPNATPQQLYDAVMATATHTANGLVLANPEAFIRSLER